MQENVDSTLIKNFGGIVTSARSWLSPINTFADIRNLVPDGKGSLIKRSGVKQVISDPNGYWPLIPELFSSNYMVVSQPLGYSYKGALSDVEATAFTNVSLPGFYRAYAATIAANNALYFAVPDDPAQGVHKTTSIAGPAAVVAGSPIGARKIVFFKGRLFAVGGFNNLWYSGALPASLDTWPATNVISIGDSSDFMVDLVPLGDRILVFKTNSIWVLYLSDDPNNWIVRLLSDNIGLGCVNSRATWNYQDKIIYFIAPKGVYATDGTNIRKLSEAIDDYFVNRGVGMYQPDFLTVADDDVIYCSIYPGETSTLIGRPMPNNLFTFNLNSGGWSRIDLPFEFPTAPLKVLSQINSSLYIGTYEYNALGPAGTGMYRMSRTRTADDIGGGNINISCSFKTNRITIDRPNRMHRLLDAYLFARAGRNVFVTPPGVVTPRYRFLIDKKESQILYSKDIAIEDHGAYRLTIPGVHFRELALELTESSQLPLEVSGIELMTKLKSAAKGVDL